jgi:hypothetical protein
VRQCGYPDRLLLLKGKQDGTPFGLFVILPDFVHELAGNKAASTYSSKMR